jgi:DNA-binding IclR family transcriptional regulator
MAVAEKTLGILSLFTPETPVWTSDALIAHLGCPPSTGYRHIKELQSSGLLTRVGSSSYRLGPRVLELDRAVRLSDPVYVVGSPIICALRDGTGHSAVLATLYSDSIVCVRRELAPDGPPSLFSRGQKRPLVAGASAKAILAYLPAHQLRRIHAKHGDAIAAAALGANWEAFLKTLRQIRKAGFSMTVADYNQDIAAIAAPIFNKDNEVLGSVMLAISIMSNDLQAFAKLAPEVVAAAREISRQIALLDSAATLSARAVG